MDYFGRLVDDLVDMAEEIERLHPRDGARVIRGLERVMKLAVEAENLRHARSRPPTPAPCARLPQAVRRPEPAARAAA